MKQFGRYQIKGYLGGGGMADVYQAYDPNTSREVALKVIKSDYSEVPNFRHRFKREARIMESLRHPAIVELYDFGEQDNQLYLVMPLMSGGMLSRRFNKDKPFLPAEALQLYLRLAPALDMAHQKNIVHRDLKPANILFDKKGQAYIADFGIAKMIDQSMTLNLTRPGIPIGTPPYMSPEQARSQQDIDSRSDIYTLGVILFELLTGQRPYKGKSVEDFINKHVYEPVPSLLNFKPDLSANYDVIIQKAMAKNRENRYATVGDMVADLRAVVANPDDPIWPEEPTIIDNDGEDSTILEPTPNPWRQRLIPMMAAFSLLLIIGGGTAFVVQDRINEPTPSINVRATGQRAGQSSRVASTVTLTQASSSSPVPATATGVSQVPTLAPATAVPTTATGLLETATPAVATAVPTTAVPPTAVPPAPPPTQSAEELAQIGNDYYNSGQFESARDAYSRALEVAPSSQLYFNRGNSYLALNESDKAIADFTEAIAIDDEYDAQAFNHRGVAHKRKEAYNQAIADYGQAISINPQYANAYYNRGNLHEQLGNQQEAIDDYQQVVSINDGSNQAIIDWAKEGLQRLGAGN